MPKAAKPTFVIEPIQSDDITKDGKPILQCYMCNKEIISGKISNLKRHMKLHDSIQEYYRCSKCKTDFQTKSNFQSHKIKRHLNEKTVECVRIQKTGKVLPKY